MKVRRIVTGHNDDGKAVIKTDEQIAAVPRIKAGISDAEREIVVNLINAKWHAAYSNYEHEMIGERAGLPPEKVQA